MALQTCDLSPCLTHLLSGRCRIADGMPVTVLFDAQADQNRKHYEADNAFFLSRENKHQLRRGLT